MVNAKAHELFVSGAATASGKNGAAYSQVIASLNDAWHMFFPAFSFSAEPVADRPETGFDVFYSAGSDARLPVDSLSSGQLELFCFAGTLLTESFSEGILLIDEPELHLDPQWHRFVLRMLRRLKPDCQIIVATHSPEVYDSVCSFERHFLVPDDDPRAKAWATGSVPAEVDEGRLPRRN